MPDNPRKPLTDRESLLRNNEYNPEIGPAEMPNLPYTGINTGYTPGPDLTPGGSIPEDSLAALDRAVFGPKRDESGKLRGGSPFYMLSEIRSDRYPFVTPGANMEHIYGSGQSWYEKAAHGILKGVGIAGTTFLSNTAGLVNGLLHASVDGNLSSFYNNDFTRGLQEFNERMENTLPNYYTTPEVDPEWHGTMDFLKNNVFTANFLFDQFIKNLGFTAGSVGAAAVYASLLNAVGLGARLVAAGEGAAALGKSQEAILNTTSAIGRIGKLNSDLAKLAASVSSKFASLDKGQRAIVAGLSTLGEAAIESLQNRELYKNQLIDTYRKTHGGQAPDRMAMELIDAEANRVGDMSMILNSVLLTGTQYIQLPRIMGNSYLGNKAVFNGIEKDINDYAFDAAKKEFVEKVPTSFLGKAGKAISNWGPRYGYSATESFEELSQSAITFGVQNYFNKGANPTNIFTELLGEGYKNALTTKQGVTSALIGGLSGKLSQNIGQVYRGEVTIGDILFGRDSKASRENTAEFVKALNKGRLVNYLADNIEANTRAEALQTEMDNHIRRGDIFATREAEIDYMHNYLTPRIKYGKFDLVMEDIQENRKLASTDQGWQLLKQDGIAKETDTRELFLQRLDNMEEHAKAVKDLYEGLNIRLSGLRNNAGERIYPDKVIDKLVYAGAKITDYDRRMPQVSAPLVRAGIAIQAAVDERLNSKETKLQDEVKFAAEQFAVDNPLEGPSVEQAYKDIFKMVDARAEFVKEYRDIEAKPKEYDEIEPEDFPETNTGEIKTARVVTGDGEQDLEIGTEYFAGFVPKVSTTGVQYKDYPRFKILKVNEDGTIQIQSTENGGIHNVQPNYLAKYRVSKVEDIDKYPKLSWYLRNSKQTVYRKLGNGKKQEGILEYDSKERRLYFQQTVGGNARTEIRDLKWFEAQKGYKEGIYTFGKPLTEADRKDMVKDTPSSRARGLGLITLESMVEQSTIRFKELDDKLSERKAELDKVLEQLKQLRIRLSAAEGSKRGISTAALDTYTRAINRLEKLQDNLEVQVGWLNEEMEVVQGEQDNLLRMIDDLDELPEKPEDALAQLKEDVEELKELEKAITKQISTAESLIGDVVKAIRKIGKAIRTLAFNFGQKDTNLQLRAYPGIQQMLDRVNLIESRPVLNLNGYPEAVKDLIDEMRQIEEFEVVPKVEEVQKLREDIEDLKKQLNLVQTEIKVKQKLIEKFGQRVAVILMITNAEKALAQKAAFDKEIGGPMREISKDNDPPTGRDSDEAGSSQPNLKPSLTRLFRKTSHPSRNLKPSHARFERFTNKYDKFSRELINQLRAIPITTTNQASVNLQGFIEHVAAEPPAYTGDLKDVDHGIIAWVVVREDAQGNLSYVDEDGKDIIPLAETTPDKQVDFNRLIHDNLSDTDLVWESGEFAGEPRYHTNVSDVVATPAEYQRAAVEYRKAIFDKAELDPDDIMRFSPSRGLPRRIVDIRPDGTRVYEFNAVDEVFATTEDLINSTDYIDVGTGEEVRVGDSDKILFLHKGRPYLKTANDIHYLHNRPFNDSELDILEKAIQAWAVKFLNPDENLRYFDKNIFRFLKGMIYARVLEDSEADTVSSPNQISPAVRTIDGEPTVGLIFGRPTKDANGNYEEAFLSLSQLANRDDRMRTYLSTMYNNVSRKLIKNNEVFVEMQDFNPTTGEVTRSREWRNYSLFLLSSRYVDPNGVQGARESQIPLGTSAARVDADHPFVYEQRYLVLEDARSPYYGAKAKITPTPPASAAPATSAPAAAAAPQTRSYFEHTSGIRLYFTKVGDKITILKMGDYDKFFDLAKSGDPISDEVVENRLIAVIEGAIKLNLIRNEIIGGAPVAATAAPKMEPTPPKTEAIEEVYRIGTSELFYKNFGTAQHPAVTVLTDKGTFDETIKQMVEDAAKRNERMTAEEAKARMTKHIEDHIVQTYMFSPEFKSFTEEAPPWEAEGGGEINLRASDDDNYRVVGSEGFDVETITPEQWETFKAWMKENLPQLPFKRALDLIKTTRGGLAWGRAYDKFLEIYEHGAKGTEYHEAFEGVWKYFVPMREKRAMFDEFRGRKGTFEDRETGEIVKYSEATWHQAKERMADEFAEYRDKKVIPQKPAKGMSFILKMFVDLWNFIKSVFTKKSLIDDMFSKINTGYYKTAEFREIENEQEDYALVPGLSARRVHEGNQHITALIFRRLYKHNKNLFEFQKKRYSSIIPGLYDEIIPQLRDEGYPPHIVEALINYNKKYLEQYGVIITDLNEEGKSEIEGSDIMVGASEYAKNAFRVDIHSANAPMRLLFSAIERSEFEPIEGTRSLIKTMPFFKKVKALRTVPDQRIQLAERGKLIIQVLQMTKKDNTFGNMVKTLVRMAADSPEMAFLAERLKIDETTGEPKYDALDYNDWRLLINFFVNFNKQQPDAVYEVAGDEDDKTGYFLRSSDLNRIDRMFIQEWMENLKRNPEFVESVPGGYRIKTERFQKYKDDKLNPFRSLDFLIAFGITNLDRVRYERLVSVADRAVIDKSVNRMFEDLPKVTYLLSDITPKSLGVAKRINDISRVVAKALNTQSSSTVAGVTGGDKQKYVQHNAASVFANDFNSVKTLDELLTIRPELNEPSRLGSQVLKPGGLFFNSKRERIRDMVVGYFDGRSGSKRDVVVSDMTFIERFVSEINQNLDRDRPRYYILMPADATTEWTQDIGNLIGFDELGGANKYNRTLEILKEYLRSEIQLIIDKDSLPLNDYARRKDPNGVAPADRLRNFEAILSPETLAGLNAAEDKHEYYNQNQISINADILAFIQNERLKTYNILHAFEEVKQHSKNSYSWNKLNIDFEKKVELNRKSLTQDQLDQILDFVTVNYIINNIEIQKLVFGDIAEYKDPTKRFKLFMSPRGIPFTDTRFHDFATEEFNEGIKTTDFGYSQFTDHIVTSTVDDFNVVSQLLENEDMKRHNPELYKAHTSGKIDSSDGSSWASPLFARQYKMRAGEWNEDDDEYIRFDMAMARLHYFNNGRLTRAKYSEELEAADRKLTRNGNAAYPIKPQEVFKPILSGVDIEGRTVVHKYSVMPLYFSSVIKGTLSEDYFFKIIDEGVDYIIVPSGEKVGTSGVHQTYVNGQFNNEPFNNKKKILWRYIGKQVETAHSEKSQTTGSQLTKISTLDLMEAGRLVVEDPDGKLAEEIAKNRTVLEAMIDNGYKRLLEKLGITETQILGDTSYIVPDINKPKLAKFLREVLYRLDPDDNLRAMLTLNDAGEFELPFETTHAYQRIKNVLLSQVDKNIVSRKVNGGAKVQISAAMYNTPGMSFYYKRGDEWIKATEADLSNPDLKIVPMSNALKFYEPVYKDGKIVSVGRMEVYLPAWFKKRLPRELRELPDEELFKKISDKNILRGIGFRIPTQALSAVEVFEVKGFLPENVGNTVVVPADITLKAGSDFDIDKLNTYLKNIFINSRGEIIATPFLGYGDAGKEAIREYLRLDDVVARYFREEEEESEEGFLFGETADRPEDRKEEDPVEKFYIQSLENEYFRSLDFILTHPSNFTRLLQPNSNLGLPDMRDTLMGINESEFGTETPSLVSRAYMSKIRHYYISGKQLVGIAAVNITGHAQGQRFNMFIDKDKIRTLPERTAAEKFMKESLQANGTSEILLDHNTTDIGGIQFASLSKRHDAGDEDFISDLLSAFANGFVDITKDLWITQLNINRATASTVMFMARVGVPKEQLIYFINQPIIREFIKVLDHQAISNAAFAKEAQVRSVRRLFSKGEARSTTLDKAALKGNIEKYYRDSLGEKMTDEFNAQQHLILDEFMKYTMMASHLFDFTQATNYDTARFLDTSILDRKVEATRRERTNNIISSVGDYLGNSFVGHLSEVMVETEKALSSILLFERPDIKRLLNQVKEVFYTKEARKSDIDLNVISNRITASFIDFLVLNWGVDPITHDRYNRGLTRLFGPTEIGDAIDVLRKHKRVDVRENPFVQVLTTKSSPATATSPATTLVVFKTTDRSPDTRNLYINSIAELLEAPRAGQPDPNPEIRRAASTIIRAGLVQNGIFMNPFTFNDLIPVKVYSNLVTDAIRQGLMDANIEQFVKNNVFFRVNATRDVVQRLPNSKTYSIPGFRDQPLISLDPSFAQTPVVKIERIKDEFLYRPDLTDEMKGREDYSYWDKRLYQLVLDKGEPLLDQDGKHVYKQINAWTFSGGYIRESYLEPKSSVMGNEFQSVTELTDDQVVAILRGPSGEAGFTVGSTTPTTPTSSTPAPIGGITFQADDSTAYAPRTRKNASADATIAIAVDFTSSGEKLTYGSVVSQKKKFIPLNVSDKDQTVEHKATSSPELKIPTDKQGLKVTPERVKSIVDSLNSVNAKTLNIAGNGAYTMKGKFTQKQVDEFVYELLKAVVNDPSLKNKITLIRSGGQTGFDEAGIKAAVRLGIPALILAPNDWTYRDVEKGDIHNDEKGFKARFNIIARGPSTLNIYAGTNENKDLSNMAIRPFVYLGGTFNSVEQAFQEAKLQFTKATAEDIRTHKQISETKDPFEAKRLGRQYKTLDAAEWDENSSKLMKIFIKASFEQNPKALERLLSTGNAVLTHAQDRGKWGTEFPKLLMEVRSELGGKKGGGSSPASASKDIFTC